MHIDLIEQTRPASTRSFMYEEQYADRAAVGRQLAEQLQPFRGQRALILALSPGGVVVAGELARVLRLRLDVLITRSFAVAPYPGAAAGALSEGGGMCLNAAVLRLPGVSMEMVWQEARRTQQEITMLLMAYRGGAPLPLHHRRPVILVDDGLSNGLVQLAAIHALRREHIHQCVVASPYGTPEIMREIARYSDTLVVQHTIAQFQPDDIHWRHSLGDDEAIILLQRYKTGWDR